MYYSQETVYILIKRVEKIIFTFIKISVFKIESLASLVTKCDHLWCSNNFRYTIKYYSDSGMGAKYLNFMCLKTKNAPSANFCIQVLKRV